MHLLRTWPRADLCRAEPSCQTPLVEYCLGERTAIAGAARRLLGADIEDRRWADLAGAPEGSEVEVSVYRGGLYLELRDPAAHGYHGVWRIVGRAGQTVLYLDALYVRPPEHRGHGLGLQIFHRQVRAAAALGVARILTRAGRRDDENGYYTWPRFGFDGPLPRRLGRSLPPACRDAVGVLDLMQSAAGRIWWRQHGFTLPVVFDLAPASRSRRVLAQYLAQRRPSTR